MALTRYYQASNSINILNAYFEKYPAKLAKCRETSKEQIKKGYTNRIFDEFPLLISANEFDHMKRFVTSVLINLSQHATDVETNTKILSPWNKHQIKTQIIMLATQGYNALIDTNGKLNPELVGLLDWHEFKNKINICDLICSFTSITFGTVISALQEEVLSKLDSLEKCESSEGEKNRLEEKFLSILAISNYFNSDSNSRKWVIEALNNAGYPYQDKPAAKVKNNHHTRDALIIGAAATLAILSGSAAIAAATGAGIGMFTSPDNANRHRHNRDSERDDKPRYR